VVNQDDATTQIIDGQTGAPIAMLGLPLASRPYGIGFDPGGNQAYVTLEATGRLLRIDRATLAITADADVGPTPRGIGISWERQRIFVPRFISPSTPGGDDQGEVRELASSDLRDQGQRQHLSERRWIAHRRWTGREIDLPGAELHLVPLRTGAGPTARPGRCTMWGRSSHPPDSVVESP